MRNTSILLCEPMKMKTWGGGDNRGEMLNNKEKKSTILNGESLFLIDFQRNSHIVIFPSNHMVTLLPLLLRAIKFNLLFAALKCCVEEIVRKS